jgi:hypothetical protein
MPLSDKQRTGLARDLQRVIARVAPDWTDFGAHDPGITMLQLLAFTLADLQHRHSALSPHARLLARDVATRAVALAEALDGAGAECGSGLVRVNYFAGMVLGVDEFRTEQDYVRHRLNRRNQLVHGAGIVAGLQVKVAADGDAARVAIAPGLAFDPAGNEICIDVPCLLTLPAAGASLLVQLSYREQPCRTVATMNEPVDPTGATAATRIVETFDATLASLPAANALALARVQRVRGRWRVDAKFKAPRVRR